MTERLNDGTSPIPVSYDPGGIDGFAVIIEDPNQFVIVDNNIGIFPGATLSTWILPIDLAEWHVVMETTGEEDGSIHLFQEDDLLIGEVFGGGYAEGVEVVAEVWQHAVLVYNSVDEVIQLYLNGELIAEDDADADVWAQVGPLTIGAAMSAEEGKVDYFAGGIDDTRIYNYALTCVQVASLYTHDDFMPEAEVCCVDYSTDLSGSEDVPDCRVDIYDLVAFVQNWWLECNMVPDCAFELP